MRRSLTTGAVLSFVPSPTCIVAAASVHELRWVVAAVITTARRLCSGSAGSACNAALGVLAGTGWLRLPWELWQRPRIGPGVAGQVR